MKQISGSHCFLHLFTNTTSQHLLLTALSLCECKLAFCLVIRWVFLSGEFIVRSHKVWNLIVQYRSGENEGWLVDQICLRKQKYWLAQQYENWQILQQLSFPIPVGAGGLFSQRRLLLYYFKLSFTAFCRSSAK